MVILYRGKTTREAVFSLDEEKRKRQGLFGCLTQLASNTNIKNSHNHGLFSFSLANQHNHSECNSERPASGLVWFMLMVKYQNLVSLSV